MFCQKCGAEINDNPAVCPKCGVPVAGTNTAPGNAVKVPNHMVGAILSTLFCCLIGGIVSIVYAAKVNTKLAQGDIAGAQSASKVALRWIIANVIFEALVLATGVLLGALAPAISNGMLSAQLSAAHIKGRNLFVCIAQSNIEREHVGFPDIWPRTAGSDLLSTNKDDISGMAFESATDYFMALFDMKSYGKDEWAPYVSADPGLLKLSKDDRFCDWIVAANVQDKFDDNIPVLISANVDPATLKTSYDGLDSSPIPLGSRVGRTDIPWGDKVVVVIRKGGSSQIIPKKDFTYDVLYNKHSFSAPGLKYLDVK